MPALRDELVPGSPAGPGALIGYARVSKRGQKLDAQIRALTAAGCVRVFSDEMSGRNADRPELAACRDYLRPGDTLVVTRLDRLGRSLQDLITVVSDLRRRGTGFRSLHEALDTTTPGGRLVFHVFAALAEFVRELIVEGTYEGLDAAPARGVRLGRPPAMTSEQIRHARSLLAEPENSVASIARLLGVSRSTIYKYVPEVAGGSTMPGISGGDWPGPIRGARPGRGAVVAGSLADLHGPAAGVVELPLHLFWSSPDRTFDLDRPAMARSMYEAVLREASSAEDLAAYLDGGILARVWPDLYLPRGVRQTWEDQHPELRPAAQDVA